MPTVTWARVDPARRAAVVEAAEAEFGVHGFSGGSLNVIARRAGVAKGSLFQYFADKRDLYAFIADVASQRVRAYMEDRIRELDPSRPFFDFLTDWLDAWVAYFADNPHERALHAAATLEVDTEVDWREHDRLLVHMHDEEGEIGGGRDDAADHHQGRQQCAYHQLAPSFFFCSWSSGRNGTTP